MRIKNMEIHCANCGSTEVRSISLAGPDALIICNKCDSGRLLSEIELWQDDWKCQTKRAYIKEKKDSQGLFSKVSSFLKEKFIFPWGKAT